MEEKMKKKVISEKMTNGVDKEVECIINKKLNKHWIISELVRYNDNLAI